MKRSNAQILMIVGMLCSAFLAGAVYAGDGVPDEPTPFAPPIRQPDARGDYVRNWYIYSDTKTDGILDPGDTYVNTMKNWWTPVSSGTQNNMWDNPDGNGGYSSGPMNFATSTDSTADNYWLPRSTTGLHFYLTYSQLDNNTASQFLNWVPEEYGKFMNERHGDTNGWALGWVAGDVGTKSDPIGNLSMDIYVHDGKYSGTLPDTGTEYWNSNPQVTQSNGMSTQARDALTGCFVPPKWSETTKNYTSDANTQHMAYEGLTPADIVNIGASMEVHEQNPYGTYMDTNAVDPTKTPNLVKATLTDDQGNPYTYDDAVTVRNTVYEGESKGGVIGGLAGLDSYDPEINNWGQQQVIRIDLDQDTLALYDEVVFYDFGYAAGTDQTHPEEIVFNVYNDGGYYWLYYDSNGNHLFDVGEEMPDNRIYIARVDMAPEPTTLALMGLGAAALLRRRRNRA